MTANRLVAITLLRGSATGDLLRRTDTQVAELLYRIGRSASRRPLIVILGWLVTLALAVGGLLAFGGSLTTSLSIPGTETERVTGHLTEEIGELGGGTGTVLFHSQSGAPFTGAQRQEISQLLDGVASIGGVAEVVDPFEAEAERVDQEQELQAGGEQLDAAQRQLDDGAFQIETAQAQLDTQQAQLDASIAAAQAAGTYELASAQFETQQAELNASAAQLDIQRGDLEAVNDELADQRAQLVNGQVLVDAAAEIRTVTEDGETAIGVVLFEDDLFSVPSAVMNAVTQRLDEAAIDGVGVDYYSAGIATAVEGLVGTGELVGVGLALLVLMLMLRALLPAMLPIVSSLIGVGVGVTGALSFSAVVDMSSATPVLGMMLGLAVGIDYALFIINRHRQQLLAGIDLSESIPLANGTSGNAVVFAGSTILVALLALNVTGIPFIGVMGTVAAGCVLIAVIIAVTMTPALLGLVGHRVLHRRARAQVGHDSFAHPDLKPMRTSSALIRAALAIVSLIAVAVPALSMRLGMPDGSSEPVDSTQYRAFTAAADAFGAGQNGPLLVTAALPVSVDENDVMAVQADIVEQFLTLDEVVAVAPVGVSKDRDFLAFQVVPIDGPSSESTEQLVHDLRNLSPLGQIELGVAGQASGNIDISEKLAAVLPVYLTLVVGLSFLILVLVFRSVIVPLVATAGFVLSLFAAFGAVVAVYQWGWLGPVFDVHDPGPVLNFAPIVLVGVLFGLAMDYQLFLVSGMREAFVHGAPARMAVVVGLRNARAVVTAAAIIMGSVFGGFVFSHIALVRPIGFGLAAGVLLDAFVVRLLLIPAVMYLLGEKAWWLPKWLDRVLPNVDLEGAALERSHPVGVTTSDTDRPAPQLKPRLAGSSRSL
jgi:RND superfamily putative drug exporter